MLQYVIWDVNPEIFSIGSLSIRWYGLLFALGFLIGMQIMVHIFRKENKPVSDTDTLLLFMVIATVLGARIGHFLFYEPQAMLRNPLEVILPPYRGLASHGAFPALMLGLWLYSRRKSSRATGQTFLWLCDRIVITVALAGAFIRLGNLMNSEIVGRPTDLPWGFVFLLNDEFSKVPRHPSQLYEALSCLLLFFLLFWLWNQQRERTPPGRLFGIFLIWVFTLRFFYEYLKENQVASEANMYLNIGQQLSIPVVLIGIFVLVRSFRSRPSVPTSTPTT